MSGEMTTSFALVDHLFSPRAQRPPRSLAAGRELIPRQQQLNWVSIVDLAAFLSQAERC